MYYTTNYNGTNKRVLFLRQVDNFAIACETKELANQVVNDIDSKMSIKIKELGLVSRYNGVDVQQTKHYIKIHNTTYIIKLIDNHSWLQQEPSLGQFPLPINPDPKYHHQLEMAEPLTEEEKQTVESEMGFKYRQAVGKLIYAMVTCRPDISFAIIKLSQYTTHPARIHYDALKHLYRYLVQTKADGIYYWREQPREDLSEQDVPSIKRDGNYEEHNVTQRQTIDPHVMTALVDSDHASDSQHRKSVTGINIKIAGGTVLYKTKYQDIVAQSTTKAKFIAAAEAGKAILYLRTILDEIGLEQQQATILYKDNQGALLMAKAGRPAKQTKHMDIKYFALQQ